jgi:hypothetical protein
MRSPGSHRPSLSSRAGRSLHIKSLASYSEFHWAHLALPEYQVSVVTSLQPSSSPTPLIPRGVESPGLSEALRNHRCWDIGSLIASLQSSPANTPSLLFSHSFSYGTLSHTTNHHSSSLRCRRTGKLKDSCGRSDALDMAGPISAILCAIVQVQSSFCTGSDA